MKLKNGSVDRFGEVRMLGLVWCLYRGGAWFRMHGHGLNVQNRRIIPALYSERSGTRKTLRVGKWALWALRPRDFKSNQLDVA